MLAAAELPEAGADLRTVSVVIPCFDQGHYLAEAIDSVLAQTLATAEIVVVDDGSRDNSFEVAGRYPAVRRLRQPNRGAPAARNAGLAASNGDCVVFLDADDRLLPQALAIGMAALAKRPHVAFVAGLPRDIADDGTVLPGERQPLVGQDHYVRLLEDCFIWSGSSIAYRRAALESLGGFDESLAAGDDYDLYLRLARRFPVYCHDTLVTEYRRHATNTTRDPAVVLASQLEVLRRQRGRVRDRRERRARRLGIRNTRRQHGRALAEQVARAWRGHRWRCALRGARTLARRDPRSLTRLLASVT
ncbi:MAG TPA: glycosyltransferase [Solirubrobacteraceae bacterium]|jgi:glycosyltransferase involved in cell wall biosynthesis|nr:glycosyltransferase [Solirubrobacteraceae bacterium]